MKQSIGTKPNLVISLGLVVLLLTSAACSKQQSSSTTTETSAEPGASVAVSQSASATESAGPTFVTFQFNDVSVTSSGAPVLRLGVAVKNGGKDPQLCNESMFSLSLSNGTVLQTDTGAENVCDPDTIDPGSSGTATMFFDLPTGYTGPVTLIMRSSDTNAIIGQGTTQVH